MSRTTHPRLCSWMQDFYPDVVLTPERTLVDAGHVITARGWKGAFQAALQIISRTHGFSAALNAASSFDPGNTWVLPDSMVHFSEIRRNRSATSRVVEFRGNMMNRLVLSTMLVAAALPMVTNAQTEPTAGTWPTWVLSSGRQFRLEPPSTYGDQRSELQWLKDFMAQADANALDQVAYWEPGRRRTDGCRSRCRS